MTTLGEKEQYWKAILRKGLEISNLEAVEGDINFCAKLFCLRFSFSSLLILGSAEGTITLSTFQWRKVRYEIYRYLCSGFGHRTKMYQCVYAFIEMWFTKSTVGFQGDETHVLDK
jgi:hypothetical protein